ncbi:hypothetical protein KUV85_08795 [Nocardioides panacisoli]|uniref:hypothetical protein n=1 Tax=Nocardioides panacisoli TaxID=627624 RepID=UPI001C633970|nr:hypothetical protein [Nocardioides panacisoli]QYJ02437.1 hypothetical protein KUV85_08795 [Nocardioides panacisoli]
MPLAPRLRRTGWRDPRLWLGVLLVTVSVVGGARLLAAADDTVRVWVAAGALGAGSEVTEADLSVRRVRFADAEDLARYYRARDPFPADRVLRRGVGAGELVPRSAVVPSAQVDTLRVPLEVAPHQVPPSVTTGSVVDVYLVPASGERQRGSGPALEEVVVVDAPPVEESFAVSGARQVVVTVPEEDAATFQDVYGALDDPSVRILQRS